jgi:hypothetical protein
MGMVAMSLFSFATELQMNIMLLQEHLMTYNTAAMRYAINFDANQNKFLIT